MLGLRECCTTIVGSAGIRGVSGGQKKRVTIVEALLQGSRILVRRGWGVGGGEALCAATRLPLPLPPPFLQCMDNITAGLDASTAYDILQVGEGGGGKRCV